MGCVPCKSKRVETVGPDGELDVSHLRSEPGEGTIRVVGYDFEVYYDCFVALPASSQNAFPPRQKHSLGQHLDLIFANNPQRRALAYNMERLVRCRDPSMPPFQNMPTYTMGNEGDTIAQHTTIRVLEYQPHHEIKNSTLPVHMRGILVSELSKLYVQGGMNGGNSRENVEWILAKVPRTASCVEWKIQKGEWEVHQPHVMISYSWYLHDMP
jgi:hypothetical protein